MPKEQRKKEEDKKESKALLVVEPKKVAAEKEPTPAKVENIRIDKIGKLTLNLFAQPLKKRYEKHYKENKIHLLVDIVLAIIVLILVGVILNLWLFSRTKLINLVDFQVSSSPEVLVNGQETTFTLDYTNTTSDNLTDVTLVLKKPEALRNPIYNIEGFDVKTNTLKIGELAPKAHGQFKVTGLMLGNLNDKHEFLAVINYKNKFGQDRQEFFNQNFQLSDSVLATQITLPKRTIATSPFETKINLTNNSKLDFEKLKIKLIWPTGFNFIQTDLGETTENNTWLIGNFPTDQSANYSFQGKIYLENPNSIEIKAEIYDTFENQEYLLAQAQASTFVDFSKFKINFTNLERNHSISPGGETIYTLTYVNDEDYPVSNVELGLNLSGQYAAQKAYRFNQNNLPQLKNIEPGQSGSIEIKATAKNVIDYTSAQENDYKLEARGFASFDDPNEKSRLSVESLPIVTNVNSRLSLNTTALFFTAQGDQIGVGSVPPVVGEYTSYWTIIRVINTNNKIKDLKITAQVPGEIEFTDIYNVTEGNQIIFDQNARTVTWQVSNIPAFAGIFNAAPEARIQLALVPTASQRGQSPALLTNITATATDETTGAFLTAVGKNITTAIFADESLNKVIE